MQKLMRLTLIVNRHVQTCPGVVGERRRVDSSSGRRVSLWHGNIATSLEHGASRHHGDNAGQGDEVDARAEHGGQMR